MPGPVFLTIAAGQAVSSAFYLDRSDRTWAVYCSSAAASLVTLEFGTQSGATFEPLYRTDGSGILFGVMSAANGGWSIFRPPTAWGRVRQTPATVTDNRSITLVLR